MIDGLDCRSHSCQFSLERGGQRNNGPCRCLRDIDPDLRTLVLLSMQAKVFVERERCAAMVERMSESLRTNPSSTDHDEWADIMRGLVK